MLRRALAISAFAVIVMAFAAASAAAAVPASVKFQLRGHLQELGQQPSLRVFETNAAYDSFRASLGDANVFPPASSLFMSFDTDRLVLYARGNDVGGRCLSRTATAQDGTALTLVLQWDAGTCGAPSTAHYPFLLLSLSRAAADGPSWVPAGGRSLCASAGPDTDACTTVGAVAAPAPSTAASASPVAAASPSVTAARSPSPSAATTTPTPAPTPSPTPTPSRAPATSAAPSLVAAASPTPAPARGDPGPNYILIAIVIGFVVLVAIAAIRSRPPKLRQL